MIGFVVWIVWTGGLFGLMSWAGMIPREHPGTWAASLFCVVSGLVAGGCVNQYIRDHYPKFDRWNT